jgi:hypothetical protein
MLRNPVEPLVKILGGRKNAPSFVSAVRTTLDAISKGDNDNAISRANVQSGLGQEGLSLTLPLPLLPSW